MRKMVTPWGNTVKVIEHIILRNFWEYYVLDEPTNTEHVKCCLVMGAETECGDVDMREIAPYMITRTTKLRNVAPVSGGAWGGK